MEVVFIIHIIASLFMAGICWFVQIVHYPLFLAIELKDFPKYERKNFVTAFITVPTMVIEMATGLYLLYHNINLMHFLNIGFLGLIALSTVIFQVPIHLKLSKNATTKLINKLVLTNWIRTISWTIRVVILAMLLSQNLTLPI